ncbi:uncharacterized protein [Gossypium hirsutum]|uniref:CCHC-type domain-containing protein n=1 Tax=Gossypium hirsutum TaxID=3635 RepID=A0ABM3AM73_GOSHI|nr:uncharacterized protein LOC107906583 [Gossypium hirsutum]
MTGSEDRIRDENQLPDLQIQGRTDPDAYLTWESRVEHVFECYNYSEQKKVRLAVMEFTDYALIWWDQLLISRRRTGEGPVRTWKLQSIKQGNRSVEDYYKEIEVSMMQANIVEDREATMVRFLVGLNSKISNVVELQHYVELEDMVHMAIKVERQQCRKSSNRGNTPFKSFSNPLGTSNNFRKQTPFQIKEKGETSKPKALVVDVGRGKQQMQPERSRDILCFKCLGRGHIASQCPNRRTMILLKSGEIESETEEEEPELRTVDVDEDDDNVQTFATGEALVIKRSLNTQPTKEEQQRENIFHTRCLVNDKVCVVIIDGGSCTNVASSVMVEKLGLKTTKHPNLYKLLWLNNGGEIKVNKQVLVPFAIGKYKDEVLCDVVSMDASHLLLGRPWQFDKRTTHDGFTNRYSFMHKGKKNFKMCFWMTPKGLPPLRCIKHQIDFIPGATIPNRPAYRINPEEKKELQRQILELLDKVNQITIKYRHSIPRLDDMLDELCGATIFSKIDLKSGYHQIRMKEGDEWKTTFKTKLGLYEWDHIEHLRAILQTLQEDKLFGNMEKCVFCTNKLTFLGYIVSSQGVEVDPEKIKAIQDWPRPTSIGQVRLFHGLASFCRQFVPQFSSITTPLTGIIKKNYVFSWGKEQEDAF